MSPPDPAPSKTRARFDPAAGSTAPEIDVTVDGEAVRVRGEQSILVAILSGRRTLAPALPDTTPRAGFCLMGACQECWVWLGDGARCRACTTPVETGMAIFTGAPPALAEFVND